MVRSMRSAIVIAIGGIAALFSCPGIAEAQPPYQFEYDAIDTTIAYDLATGAGSGTVSIFNTQVAGSLANVQGWSLGLAHDPTLLTAIDVDQGLYIQTVKNGSAPDFFEGGIWSQGITIGCLYCFTGCATCSYAVAKEIAVITYATVPSALAGDVDGAVAALTFSNSIGTPPMSNVVVVGGASIPALYDDGLVSLEVFASYARGDGNGSGAIDVLGDAITTLGVLFGGGTTGCLDAHDSNDDGAVDVADPVLLLGWGFAMGAPPPAPFPGCGPDPTADTLGCVDPPCP